MSDCARPVSELTIGEAGDCSWRLIRASVESIVTHPGTATAQDWLVGVMAVIAALFLLGLLLRLLSPGPRF